MRLLDEHRGSVLIVTDDPEHGDVLRRWVEGAGERPVVLAGGESRWIDSGVDETVDVVVTDVDTAAPAMRRVLERLRDGALLPGVPRLHLLRDPSWRDRLAADDGPDGVAADVMERPLDARAFRRRVRWMAEIGRLRRRLRRSSIVDEASGLPNRRYVLSRMEQEFSRARRYRTPLSLIVVDIDRLRSINRRWDEATGDRVIRAVADLLAEQCRKEDLVGRIGEDSFAFLLPGTRHRGAAVLANKLRTEAETLDLEFDGRPVDVRVSAGIGTYPANGSVTTADDLLVRADAALAEAKCRGGNRVHIDPGVIRTDSKLILVADPDPRLLELAEDFLVMDDYRVVRAQSAEAALEALRFRRPDLIILDLQMEDPEAGVPLLAAVRERIGEPACPIVGMSREPGVGVGEPDADGLDRWITKPFSVSLLRHLARELVDEADRQGMSHPGRHG